MNKTYYGLINYINSIQDKDIDNEIINELNKYNVYLENERYDRFINHFTNLLDERINNCFKENINKLTNLNNIEEFENSINNILDESNFQINLINNKLVKEKELKKLLEFIKKNHNEIIDRLKKYYIKYEDILNYLENLYLN